MHPAHSLSFDLLLESLEAEHVAGYLSKKEHGALVLYNYRPKCVHQKHWTPITEMARGIVLVPSEKKVVALPFVKFFNHGEVGSPDFPIEAGTLISEKMDGSLGIIFFHEEEWHVVTRGSFDSAQSQWAKRWLATNGIFEKLQAGTTYLAEIIYAANRIVVDYDFEKIILLGAYGPNGAELTDMGKLATGLEIALLHSFATVSDIVRACETLPVSREGFVLRKPDGHRLKFKGAAYCAAHKAQCGLTSLAVWKMMRDCEDLIAFRTNLPEEFYEEFDEMVRAFEAKRVQMLQSIETTAQYVGDMTSKEVAQSSLSDVEKAMVFLKRRPRYAIEVEEATKGRIFLFNLFKPVY